MRDVNVIAIECMRELENIGIKCGNVIKIDINTRAKKRWGQCRKIGNNYIIEVNQILLREDTDIDGLKNTIDKQTKIMYYVYNNKHNFKSWRF